MAWCPFDTKPLSKAMVTTRSVHHMAYLGLDDKSLYCWQDYYFIGTQQDKDILYCWEWYLHINTYILSKGPAHGTVLSFEPYFSVLYNLNFQGRGTSFEKEIPYFQSIDNWKKYKFHPISKWTGRHCSRYWFDTRSSPGHYLRQCWPKSVRCIASLGQNG